MNFSGHLQPRHEAWRFLLVGVFESSGGPAETGYAFTAGAKGAFETAIHSQMPSRQANAGAGWVSPEGSLPTAGLDHGATRILFILQVPLKDNQRRTVLNTV